MLSANGRYQSLNFIECFKSRLQIFESKSINKSCNDKFLELSEIVLSEINDNNRNKYFSFKCLIILRLQIIRKVIVRDVTTT